MNILLKYENIILWFNEKISNFEVHKDNRRKRADLGIHWFLFISPREVITRHKTNHSPDTFFWILLFQRKLHTSVSFLPKRVDPPLSPSNSVWENLFLLQFLLLNLGSYLFDIDWLRNTLLLGTTWYIELLLHHEITKSKLTVHICSYSLW